MEIKDDASLIREDPEQWHVSHYVLLRRCVIILTLFVALLAKKIQRKKCYTLEGRFSVHLETIGKAFSLMH